MTLQTIGSESRAIYNSHIATSINSPAWFRCRFKSACRLVPLLLALGVASLAADRTTPATQLASKIAAVTGPAAASLEVTNRSNLRPDDVEAISQTLHRQL